MRVRLHLVHSISLCRKYDHGSFDHNFDLNFDLNLDRDLDSNFYRNLDRNFLFSITKMFVEQPLALPGSANKEICSL